MGTTSASKVPLRIPNEKTLLRCIGCSNTSFPQGTFQWVPEISSKKDSEKRIRKGREVEKASALEIVATVTY